LEEEMSVNVKRIVSEIEIKDNPTAAPKYLPTREVLRMYTEYITKQLEGGQDIINFDEFLIGQR
jgi:hypothetical protein